MATQEQQLAEALQSARPRSTDRSNAPRLWTSAQIDQTEVAFRVFSNLLASDGIRAALYSLLRRTDYRFIAIFRFKGGKSASVVYVDRENLGDLSAGEVPETATYCSYVRDRDVAFVTADAMEDARITEHVAREVVRAYCGLPLTSAQGEFIGTLCHYDLVPRDPEQLNPGLLLRVAPLLVASGLIPDYPG